MRHTDTLDRELIHLLQKNSRASITHLAKTLQVSRATAQDRLTKLERQGIITGYTVNLSPDFEQHMISAHTMIIADPKKQRHVASQLKAMAAVAALYSVNGEYDFLALLHEPSTHELNSQLEVIGEIDGVVRTSTLLLLSKLH